MRKRTYGALSSSTFLNSVGSNMQLGIWPFYLQANNVGDELYGTFNTASNFVGILARALAARLGMVSENLPFAVGILASTGMMLIYALLPSSIGIAVGLSLSSISLALVMIGRTTIVGRGAESRNLATTYAIVTTIANIGLIVGTNVGAFVPFSGYSSIFIVGGLVCIMGLIVALVWLPRESAPSKSRFGVIRLRGASPTLRSFYAATCLDAFSWSIVMPFFSITPARIFNVTQEDIALIQTLMFGASTATNVVFAVLSDRLWGRKSLMAASEALGILTLGLYLAAPNVQPIFISALLMGLVISTWGPIVSAYVSEASTAQELQNNVGTWMTLTALVRVSAPIIGGYVAGNWFPRAPYLVSMILVAGTALFIQKYLKEPRLTSLQA